jgi:cysteine-rich repeat protein
MRASTVLKTMATVALLSLLGPAQATFHLMKIVEVFAGTPASPQAQYVVLQMYAPGQNLVGGHTVTFFNAAGALVATFTFPGNVANGANQAKILIATPQAATFFGITPDLSVNASMLAGGGKVCFSNTIDCVAWGAYAGGSAGVGTPFNMAGGLVPGRAALRRLDIAGSYTALDGADDTDNCAVDFVSGLPGPRNNMGAAGTIPAATCGNGALEGLEQCDDGNTSNGDSCSSTCLAQQATLRPIGDYNGDGKSDVFWRNASTGADVIWRSAVSSTQQTVTAVTDVHWQVVARGDFDGSGRADVFWRNASTGGNAIWLSAIASTKQAAPTVAVLSWKVAGAGDFDGDGKDDVLWRNDVSGANALWRSGQSTRALTLATVPDLSWRVVGVGDFDADAKADILWRNTSTGANALWRAGLSSRQQALTPVASPNWNVVGVGDFDADGKADILWRNAGTGANALWRSGLSTQQQAMPAVTNLQWRVAGVGDFNGDGHSDILWRNASTGANAMWRSALSSQQQAVTGVTNLAWIVVPSASSF